MYLLIAVGVESNSRLTCASKDEAILLMHKLFANFLRDYDYNDIKPDIMISKETEIEFAFCEDYQAYFIVEKPRTEKEEIELLLKEQEKAIERSAFTDDMLEECKHINIEIRKHLERL